VDDGDFHDDFDNGFDDDLPEGGDVLGHEPAAVDRWRRWGRHRPRTRWAVAVAAVALLVGLAGVAARGNGHPAAAPAPGATASSGETPPIRIDAVDAEAVAHWFAVRGRASVKTLIRDNNRIAADHVRQDFNALGGDCVQLGDDVDQARVGDPLPDAAAQTSWVVALAHLELGAQACVDGVSNSVPAQLSSGTNEMYLGMMTVLTLETRLDGPPGPADPSEGPTGPAPLRP
jgi:hypothetical protein